MLEKTIFAIPQPIKKTNTMSPMLIRQPALTREVVYNSSVSVMVVLGNPRNADCSQHGICRIDTSFNPSCGCQHQAKAWLAVPYPGVVRLVFEYTSMREASIEYFFQEPTFIVQSGYVLPDHVMEKLGMPGESLSIEPGEYSIFRYSGFLEISFRPNHTS
jgi:hypothetical protein